MEWGISLLTGRNFERYFAKFLREHNFEHVAFNESEETKVLRQWDVKGVYRGKEWTFEVKADIESSNTSNLVLETHQYDFKSNTFVPSGILITKADYWVQFIRDPDVFVILPTSKLRYLLPKYARRFIAMGDYIDGVMKRCLGFLISKEDFLAFSKDSIHEYQISEIEG